MSTRRAYLAPLLAFAAAAVFSRSAAADDGLRMTVDWGKLGTVLREGAVSLEARSTEGTGEHRAEPGTTAWTQPRMSVVARDWGASQPLLGRLALTDQLRLSRSSRMVVARVRLGDDRIAPFAQAGFGQWRVDTSVVPMPYDVELAGQVGGGFELHVAPRAVVALEGTYTLLYREEHEPQMLASPQLWGVLLAAKATF
jgi:hypothetical protein